MAQATLTRAPGDRDLERIRSVCTPCNYFLPDLDACRLLQLRSSWFLKVFEDKRCRPRRYLEEFVTTRLARRYGSLEAARWDAEEIASDVVLALYESPPEDGFLSPDLTGLRRFLSARAVQAEIHYRRKTEGRVRCGNCEHHRHRTARRTCNHPDPEHPWSGKIVLASLDPRTFEPPCSAYHVKRRFEEAGASGEDPLDRVEDAGDLPDAALAMEDRNRVLLECLRSIQEIDPKLSFVVAMTFFKQMANEDIALELACSTKSVVRYKARALELLQKELAKRGVSHLGDLT